MKKKLLRYLFFLAAVSFLNSSCLYTFDIQSFLGGVTKSDKGVGLLLSDIEYRKKQSEDLQNEQEIFKTRAKEGLKTINNTLSEIDEEVKKTNELIEGASGSYEEILKKKIGVLNDRRQNLTNYKEMWKEADGRFVQHIKLINEIVTFLSNDIEKKDEPTVYSWKDLDDAKRTIDQIVGEVNKENSKKERLQKLKNAEKEAVLSLKKELSLKNVEKEKIAEEFAGLAEKEEGGVFVSEMKAKSDTIEQEIDLLREKLNIVGFKIDNLSHEERYKDDEIFFLEQRLKQLQNKLRSVQKKLIVDIADVELAKSAVEKEIKSAEVSKNRIAKEKESRRIRRDGLTKNLKILERQLSEIRDKGQEKSVLGLLIESRFLVVQHERLVIDKGIDFLETKREYIDVTINLKRIKAKIIEVFYSLTVNKDDIEKWLVEFKTKQRSAQHLKKVFKDKRDEITSFISTINIEKEKLQGKLKEVEEQRNELFRGKSREFFEVIANIKRAMTALADQKTIVERHFSPISDLLLRQEEVINQYNFIVKYLESQKTIGLWKRSSRAISGEQLLRSVLEVESFFKGLFWDTPEHLSPVSIVQSGQKANFSDYLGFVLFIVLFIFLFLGFKLLLLFIRNWFTRARAMASEAFALVFATVVDFLIQHSFLVFTWLYIFFHIVFGLSYVGFLTDSYYISLFYLLSVPVLIYLFSQLIALLQDVNAKLGYLFVAEPLQLKVKVLIKIFLYATALLLPLRKAFLEYFDRDIAFSEVSLAAYTLILVIVILFFFSKDDILRIIAGDNRFIGWLRKKVDRYYYPVFGFFMFLLILSNPYIGYSNLAWYLAFAVPASIFLLYGLFLLHYFIRKFSLYLFIKEEDDEVINKFEHAKAYYGFFVVLTFIVLSLAALVILVRLWGVEGYTLQSLWQSLSDDWTIKVGGERFGFVELAKLGAFIASGLIISSLIKKFILGKLFEIFRTEPGAQNTISKILHYAIIALVIILGFAAINLSQYALAVGGLLLVGIGFGLQNQIADYFAGVLVLLERPIEIGHYIHMGDIEGRVFKISARSTTIKTACNFFITIPNRDIISKPIINRGQGRYAVGCSLKILVAFDSDPELVRKVLFDVIRAHQMVLRVPSPIVRFDGFEQNALYFYCRCFISARKVLDMWDVESDLRFAVVKAFKKNNIVIPYPNTVVHFAKEFKETSPWQKEPIQIDFDKKEVTLDKE